MIKNKSKIKSREFYLLSHVKSEADIFKMANDKLRDYIAFHQAYIEILKFAAWCINNFPTDHTPNIADVRITEVKK